MVVKLFEEFIEEGIAKKITPDKQRAENLYLESERKSRLLQKAVNGMGIDNENANDFIEYCYNTIMFFIRAKMLERGYISSGQGAHEAEVAFARILGFTDAELKLLDQLRYFRNGILYYGKRFDQEYASLIIDFTKKIFIRFKK
ncbi:MAG: hypothetical protein AABX52_00245 [Nanoarchaeota archaeon]